MIETEKYFSQKKMRIGKNVRNSNGWRPLQTDFIDNGFLVTYVIGTDDPDNSEEANNRRLKLKLKKLLIRTIENDTITFSDLKMLMRLERGLELQQSTIDKLIIIRQGGLRGIVQRIKNLFNL